MPTMLSDIDGEPQANPCNVDDLSQKVEVGQGCRN